MFLVSVKPPRGHISTTHLAGNEVTSLLDAPANIKHELIQLAQNIRFFLSRPSEIPFFLDQLHSIRDRREWVEEREKGRRK